MVSRILDTNDAMFASELRGLREHWVWFLALGIAMAALGMFVIGWSLVAEVTVAATLVFGIILVACGIAEVINAFWVGRWSGLLVHLLIGVVYTLVGVMVIDHPEEAAVSLTLLIAIFLMVAGLFRIVFALSERFPGMGWVLLNGAVTFLLGLLIYKQWPESGLWVIGLFIGIDLIFNGWAWIMLAFILHKGPALTDESGAAAAAGGE